MSVTTDTDEDSLLPTPWLTSPTSMTTDTDDDDSLSSSHTSPHSGHDEPLTPTTDNDLSSISLAQLYNYHTFDYNSSTPVPCSPSLRRSTTLPELEPATFDADPFGLHGSIPDAPLDTDMDMPDIGLRSLPGWETDNDLIPTELASKSYIPDPSAVVPTTPAGSRSLLLWDHDQNDRSDMPIPRSPSPEVFYLDPTILEECGDDEMRKVYELRQRTAKNEKRERERGRELSALLRLKLDERGVLARTTSDSAPPSSPDSTLSSNSGKPLTQPEAPKHKIKSMAQLVASMLSNRQSEAFRRHPSRKTSIDSTSSYQFSHPFPVGSAWTKAHPTPRSRLSKVILPEELMDSDNAEEQDAEAGVEHRDEDKEPEDEEDVDMDVDDRLLSCMTLDESESQKSNSSHTVTCAAPKCSDTSTL